jgi:hypothetical protein
LWALPEALIIVLRVDVLPSPNRVMRRCGMSERVVGRGGALRVVLNIGIMLSVLACRGARRGIGVVVV